MSKTFCFLPWIHSDIWNDGKMHLCCLTPSSYVNENGKLIESDNLHDTSLKDGYNSEYYKNVRKKMINEEIPAVCEKFCFDEEKTLNSSKRLGAIKKWTGQNYSMENLIKKTNKDGSIDEPEIIDFNLRFGIKCQLSCVMCSPQKSSGWIKDSKSITDSTDEKMIITELKDFKNNYNWHKKTNDFWEEFNDNMKYVKSLSFAGGEPLISNEHYDILEHAINKGYSKNINLLYNSNGIEWKSELFDMWREFKKVNFRFSIDDIKERNEYIRYPSKWSRTEGSDGYTR